MEWKTFSPRSSKLFSVAGGDKKVPQVSELSIPTLNAYNALFPDETYKSRRSEAISLY